VFFLYILIFVLLVVGVKWLYFNNTSYFEMVLDIFIMIESYFKRKRGGYQAPSYNEEIDDANSITVGYSDDHGKRLFWEKNSVEGI
jgi:hypothetical protein